jgi:hypothetical protein
MIEPIEAHISPIRPTSLNNFVLCLLVLGSCVVVIFSALGLGCDDARNGVAAWHCLTHYPDNRAPKQKGMALLTGH